MPTEMWCKRPSDGTRIPEISMGWNLWITLLEHEGVEHAGAMGFDVR